MTTTPETRQRAASHCHDCGRPMRRSNQSILDQPGTVIYGGKGLCGTHYKTYKAANRENLTTRDRFNLMTFEAWRRERRRRGIPEEGLLAS